MFNTIRNFFTSRVSTKEREVLKPTDTDYVIALAADGRYHIWGPSGEDIQSYARARDARRGLARRFGVTS